MHWSKYKEMFDAIKRLKERNTALEEMLEDMIAAKDYSKRAEKYKNDKSTLIGASSPEELVNKLKSNVYSRPKSSKQ